MSHRTAAVRDGEKTLGASLTRDLRAIGKSVAKKVSRVAKAVGDDEIDSALGAADWATIAASVKVQLIGVAKDGSEKALALLGVDDEGILEQTYTAARDWATARSAELVGKSWDEDGNLVDNPDADMAITDSLRDELRAAVSSAVDEGLSAADLADQIEEISGFSADRAMMIARTEIIRANNEGHLAAFKSSGVVSKKEWSTSEDGDTCEDCEGNSDDGEIDLDDEFSSGDDAAPAHPNCRCTITAVVDEDVEEEQSEDEDSESEDDE